jgi:hypothetical protein
MTAFRQGYGAQAGTDCPREQEVVNAVLCGRWPDGCDESLLAHAAHCATCREVAQVSVLLHEDVDQARIDVIVPAAGQVWWRAAVRARLESTQAAARPMSWMHAITGAILLGAFLAVITAIWPRIPGLVRVLRSVPIDLFPSADVASAIAGGLAQSLVIGLVAAAILVVAPLAIYFALSDD